MNTQENSIPVWEKFALTINEASEYFNIGEKKLRKMIDENGDIFSMLNGSKILIKRCKFEDFLNKKSTL